MKVVYWQQLLIVFLPVVHSLVFIAVCEKAAFAKEI